MSSSPSSPPSSSPSSSSRDITWRPLVPLGHTPYSWIAPRATQSAKATNPSASTEAKKHKTVDEKSQKVVKHDEKGTKGAKGAADSKSHAPASSSSSTSTSSASSASSSALAHLPPSSSFDLPPASLPTLPFSYQSTLPTSYITDVNLWESKLDEKSSSSSSSPILPIVGQRNILVTSALPYVNNLPHLGTLIGCVLSADVYARFCRLRGHNAIYICGTDEHGTATETKAMELGVSPKEVCDKYYELQRDIYAWFNISFNHFGRTSKQQQVAITQDIFRKLDAHGYIQEQEMQQLYCETCKRFLADRYVEGVCPHCGFPDARGDQCDKCSHVIEPIELGNPKCKVCKSPPIKKSTRHLFLDLPKVQNESLQQFVDQAEKEKRWTQNALDITKAWLKDLHARCITRDLKWGVPVPTDGRKDRDEYKDKVFYVWFDAPIGYISITAEYTAQWEKWWKRQRVGSTDDEYKVELVQFMGKDNVPFHSVLFPSSLLGTKDPYVLVKAFSTTEFLNYEGGKFSKSRNVGVFGDNAQESGIDPDLWRFHLLFNRPESSDTMFLWEDFAGKVNSLLKDKLGNFINRVLKFVKANYDGKVPKPNKLTKLEEDLVEKVEEHVRKFIDLMELVQIRDSLAAAVSISELANRYMQNAEAWENFKTDRSRADTSIYIAVQLVHLLSALFYPFIPASSLAIQQQVNAFIPKELLVSASAKEWKWKFAIQPGHVIGNPQPIFKGIEKKTWEELRMKYADKSVDLRPILPLDLKLGIVNGVAKHQKWHVLTIQFGACGVKEIIADLKNTYSDEQLLGKAVVVALNATKRNYKGKYSEGHIMTAAKGTTVFGVLTLNAADIPSSINIDSLAGKQILAKDSRLELKDTFDIQKDLKTLKLEIDNDEGRATFEGRPLIVELDGGKTIQIKSEHVGNGGKIQ